MAKTKKKKTAKRPSKKTIEGTVSRIDDWTVVRGRLVPQRGRPPKTSPLFQYVAEKLPYVALNDVKKWMLQRKTRVEGVYLAHDSMGAARYGGRGKVFSRLARHKERYPRELTYFSFYIINDKKHEREIETIILRAAGHQMILNQRKVRDDVDPGNIRDYEPGTMFFERQNRKGKKMGAKKRVG